MKLHSVIAFNTKQSVLYANPEPPTEDGTVVGIDASGSMKSLQDVMKLIASVVKCTSGTRGLWNLPDPAGGTALVDTVDTLFNDLDLSIIKNILIISDGEDTASKRATLLERFAESMEGNSADGVREVAMPVLPSLNYWLMHIKEIDDTDHYHSLPIREKNILSAEYNEWHRKQLKRRREAVANHFSALNINFYVVGVGAEVAPFVAACARAGTGINTALIEKAATPEDVSGIITTVVSRKRRKAPVAVEDGATSATDATDATDATVTATNATPLQDADVASVKREAERTSTASERRSNEKLLADGLPFDPEAQKRYVDFIVDAEANKHDLDVQSVRGALSFFYKMAIARGDEALASDLIGGRLYPRGKNGTRNGSVFDIPEDSAKASVWSNTLGRVVELLARNPEWIYDRVPGLKEAFRADIDANRVGAVFVNVGRIETRIAITSKELPQLSDRSDVDKQALYYKFKPDTYETYMVNHRSLVGLDFGGTPLEEMKIVWRGNSGAASYGGPAVEAPSALAPEEEGEPSSKRARTEEDEPSAKRVRTEAE